MSSSLLLTPSYDPWVVMGSILIATLAGYLSLDLAKRTGGPDRAAALFWWAGGSLALGTGIWSMHFIGMLAYTLPIALGYTKGLTLLSWLAAVGVSAVALAIASRATLTPRRLATGSLVMGAGICAMHYVGMAAIDLTPGIVWDTALIATSALVAVLASGMALAIFFWLRKVSTRRGPLFQALAAVVIGLAISGMHYTGMAAAGFPAGAVCLSAGSLAGSNLGALVGLASAGLLLVTLGTSLYDANTQRTTRRLARSLQFANAELQRANAQLQAANGELKARSFIDPLTNLANRSLFEERLQRAIEGPVAGADGAARKVAVLFVDLDGFKPVNDSLGHAIGDALLMETAQRLSRIAGERATVARVGGDEFLVLMEDVGTIADCTALADHLVLALARPFAIAGQSVEITASVGVVLYPDEGQRDKLVAHADSAMYVAKRAGGNGHAVYASYMDADALDHLLLQNDLRHAVELGQMELHYQPKVDCRRGQIIGVEALLRWKHPTRGMVSPALFVPIAERSGVMSTLGQWVIEEACAQIGRWADDGLRMRVAINLSVYQLREADLVVRIGRELARHHVDASQLLCEITESLAMDDIKATQATFNGLAQIGVYLSIDDFGTGYSSLAYLRQLPARQLKIDRSFVNDLEASNDARAVVDAVIRLAHALGLAVVAEGVETEGQRTILRRLGCDELQGYLFARPMPASVLLDWTRGRKPEGAVDFAPSVLQEA